MIEARYGRKPKRTRRKAALLDHVVDEIFNARRILASDEIIEVVEERWQGQVGTMVVALALAGEAVIGVERDDNAWTVLVACHVDPHAVDFH